jgi:hypothetical protein
VSDIRWFEKAEMKRLIVEHPEQFTPGAAEVIKRYYS